MNVSTVLGRCRTVLRATLVAAAMGLSAPSAQSAVFQGSWDPAFGSAFPDLGWRGEAEFFVPDACLGESGWVFNFESCSAYGMKIVSAEVEFYKLSDPNNAAFHETLEFDVPSTVVISMLIEDGALAGVYGGFPYFVASSLPLAGGPYSDFLLFFEGDLARMKYVYDPPEGRKRFGFSDRNPPDGAPFMTFRVVPEPAGLPLLLAGLGLIALVARRRAAR